MPPPQQRRCLVGPKHHLLWDYSTTAAAAIAAATAITAAAATAATPAALAKLQAAKAMAKAKAEAKSQAAAKAEAKSQAAAKADRPHVFFLTPREEKPGNHTMHCLPCRECGSGSAPGLRVPCRTPALPAPVGWFYLVSFGAPGGVPSSESGESLLLHIHANPYFYILMRLKMLIRRFPPSTCFPLQCVNRPSTAFFRTPKGGACYPYFYVFKF